MTSRNLGIGVGVLALIAAAIIAVVTLGPAGADDAPANDDTSPAITLPTETVRIGDLIEEKEATGQVGYGQSWVLPIDAQGIVTARHAKGTTVAPGQALVWVDNKPVVLAAGTTPMYRTLELTGSTQRTQQQGQDVRQLQQFLIDTGYGQDGDLEADGVFGRLTRTAVKEWQKAAGLTDSGAVDRSQMVFHPSAVRLDSEPQVGASLGELQATGSAQQIQADFDNKSRPFLNVGGSVSIDLGGETITGTVTEITSSVGDDGSQKLRVSIDPASPVPPELERVTVTATRTTAAGALLVPVRALLALAGGGYGLEVETENGFALRGVEVGAIADDLAEITGDIADGDAVAVPNDQFGAS